MSGSSNCIIPDANNGFIGGGGTNTIGNTCCPSIQYFGVIGGGEGNSIIGSPGTCPSWAHHSVIGGGKNNTVCSDCSSILGGSGNTIPAAFGNSHIIGSGITLSAGTAENPGFLHVNNLWMQPATYYTFNGIAPAGTFVPGTVYVDTSLGAGKPLRIQ